MEKFTVWLKIFWAFLQRFQRIIFLGIILGVLLFIFFPQLDALFLKISRGQVIGLVGRYTTADLPTNILLEISIGLTTIDDEAQIQPGLAESWEVQEDGRVWLFRLGSHRWQDQKEVEARDINYNFEDVRIEAQGRETLKFTLSEPFAPFPTAVARPVFKKGLLGAGEWKVTRLTLVSRDFVQTLSLTNLKTGQNKTYRFYPTEEAARTAFKLGEVTRVSDLVEVGDLASWTGVTLQKVPRQDRYVGVFLNINDPLFSQKAFRQGLSYAIDKNKFDAPRALGPISPLSWAANPQVKQYNFNSARARELLGSAEEGEISINLVTAPSLLSVADKIKANWEAVGVRTEIQVSNAPPGDFQALLAIQAIPADPDQYSFWHSTQTTNITNYRGQRESQRIDKLLEDGRRTQDPEERKRIYLDFQRFLVEDSPVIFLFHPSTYTITRK